MAVFREGSGAAGLSGRDLPVDETLAAYANLDARARQYKDCGAFAGERLDRLRAAACSPRPSWRLFESVRKPVHPRRFSRSMNFTQPQNVR